ncbi:condensation domain-containing protein [Streptosporangium sp. NPDC004379]|uniref:condensation domain-containing protein n=1 Tax=Streptosporangium sp. NPDC004379 TaxID=3366189 RepID=UPI0036931E84
MTASLVDEWDRASLAQHGMWVTERAGAGGRVYAMPLAVRLDGPLDVDAMLAACAAVAVRHPVLAAAMTERDGLLRLLPGRTPPQVRFTDLTGDADGGVNGGPADDEAGAVEAAAAELVEAEIARPFDLETGPPARFTLARLAPGRHLLLLVVHHAVFDGMSKDVVLADLAAAYGGRALAPLAVPYGEAARAEQDRVDAGIAAAAEFWRERWHDDREILLPGLTAPSLRAAPGETAGLDAAALGSGLAAVAERLGVTRFEALMAALHVLLHAYGNERVAVAADLSTRTEETRDHVGPFVNELPVVSAPHGTSAGSTGESGSPAGSAGEGGAFTGSPRESGASAEAVWKSGTFAEFARRTREELRTVYRHREVPLARALGGISPRSALTPVSVSYRRRTGPAPAFDGLDASVDWAMFNGAVRNTLHLQVVDAPEGPEARLLFNPRAIGRAGCESVAADLVALLRGAAARPDAPLGELPLPPRAQGPAVAAPADAAPEAGTGLAAGSGVAGSGSGTDVGPDAGTGADAEIIAEVTAIWRELLDVDEIEPDDDLFDLGGHSLTITQIIARVRDRFGVELSFELFIDTPTVAGVTGEIAGSR